MIEDFFLRAHFRLRSQIWGRWKLRRGLPPASSRKFLEFYHLVIEKNLSADFRANLNELWDVGCANWSYASVLADFFPAARICGFEVDGGRRYWNLFRRADAAEGEACSLRESGRDARFIEGDFRSCFASGSEAHSRLGKRALVSFFFPFVSADPCRAWGLPSEYADFQACLKQAQNYTKFLDFDTADFLSCHQGSWEAELARKAYAEAEIEVKEKTIGPEELIGIWPQKWPIYTFSTV